MRLLGDPEEFVRAMVLNQGVLVELFKRDLDVKKAVRVLIDMLNDPFIHARNNAMMVLAFGNLFSRNFKVTAIDSETRSLAIQAVRQQLYDANPQSYGQPVDTETKQRLKFNAICALAALGSSEGIRQILELRSDSTMPVMYRNNASMLIENGIDDQVFVEHLKDLDTNLQLRIIKNMRRKSAQKEVPGLMDLVSSSNTQVRAEAASLLGGSGNFAGSTGLDGTASNRDRCGCFYCLSKSNRKHAI